MSPSAPAAGSGYCTLASPTRHRSCARLTAPVAATRDGGRSPTTARRSQGRCVNLSTFMCLSAGRSLASSFESHVPHGGVKVLASGEQILAFSNVESLLIAFLSGRAEMAGIPVVNRLPPGYDGTSRTLVVTRVGGEFGPDDGLDRALMRVDTYGPDKTAALDLAGTARSLIWLLPGTKQANGVIVSDIAETRGPSWLRDPGFATANRYTTRYQVLVRVGPHT
jgi:hypothetical protein